MRSITRFHLSSRRLAVLLLGLLAGLAALIVPVARAASGTVILEISQAEAINKNSDLIPLFFWAVQQDFYPKLGVDGPLPPTFLSTGPEVEQRDWAVWETPFQVSRTFSDLSVLSGTSIVQGRVELWDDDLDPDSDDQFDINPDPGKTLPIDFNVCTLRFSRSGDTTAFINTAWMPAGGESDPGRVQIRMRTSDGKPFLPNNVAITDVSPVQTVYHPRSIIKNKATALMLQLASSHSGPVQATITATLFDGITTATDVKTVTVPPEGLRTFFFDGSGSAAPFLPAKQPNFARLRYTVNMSIPADSTSADLGGLFPKCVPSEDNSFTGDLPIISTTSPTTLYMPWDWGASATPGESISPAPPSVAQVATTAATNEKFRRAIYPIDNTISAVFPGRALSLKTELEPAPTIMGWSVAAHIAGIDRLILMPHNHWFADNAGLLRFGSTAIGMSLAEFAPHAVIAEQGFSEVAVHEQGHTFRLSRHSCSTGGAAELLFGLGCRDEYTHTSGDGRPYPGSGFDVLGSIYPSGAGAGATPGTREVLNITNFMDTTGPRDGDPYDRWIDNQSYDWLSEQMRAPQDPKLISLSGYVQVPGGLDTPTGGAVTGKLLPSFTFDGVPDMPEAALNDQQGPGEGQFFVRLVTPQGDRIYRFTPQFKLEGSDSQGYGFFSFAVPWDATATKIELVGPGKTTDIGNPNGATGILIGMNVSSAAPVMTKLRAAAGKAPDLGAGSFTPPTIKPGEQIVIAWDQQDADTPGASLTAMLYLLPPKAPGSLSTVGAVFPIAINLVGGQARLASSQLAGLPGDYGARVVVSDGVNTSSFEVAKLFSVRAGVYIPTARR